jgi:phage N-6-adenine-methyltransferase
VSEEIAESEERSTHELFTSSKSDEWYTPPAFVRPISEAVGGFDLDPASGAESSPIAEETLTEADDGLSVPWHGRVWCNPPYSEVKRWSQKFALESRREGVELIVALIKGDTSTSWWHEYVLEADFICMVDRRLNFGGSTNSATFASHVAVYGEAPDELLRHLSTEGALVPTEAILSFSSDETAQAALGSFGGGDRSE